MNSAHWSRLALLASTAACAQTKPGMDSGVPCWADDPVEVGGSVDVETAVAAWNARTPTAEYDRQIESYPLPDAPDTLTLSAFEPTGRAWTVTSPHDPYSQASHFGCFEGDRVLVEGRVDVTSAAGLFSVENLPLVLDAPADASGEFGVFAGVDRGTMRQLYADQDGAEFGTRVVPGAEAEAELPAALAEEGWSWPDGPTWSAHLQVGDSTGRISLIALDAGSTAADPYEASIYVLDGTIAEAAPLP